MTTNNEPKSIDPIVWLGPQVFQVTFQDGRKVYLRQDNKGWYACSSAEETYDGGTIVAGGQADLLDAARNALPAASRLTDLHDLERRQRDAREHAAKRWAHYIRRGANGTGAAGDRVDRGEYDHRTRRDASAVRVACPVAAGSVFGCGAGRNQASDEGRGRERVMFAPAGHASRLTVEASHQELRMTLPEANAHPVYPVRISNRSFKPIARSSLGSGLVTMSYVRTNSSPLDARMNGSRKTPHFSDNPPSIRSIHHPFLRLAAFFFLPRVTAFSRCWPSHRA